MVEAALFHGPGLNEWATAAMSYEGTLARITAGLADKDHYRLIFAALTLLVLERRKMRSAGHDRIRIG